MIYAYFFEAKSIQSYLFQSGKLKDVIAASERLDRFIDTENPSILSEVLAQLDYSHDLQQAYPLIGDAHIRFLRAKGGAFYAFSHEVAPLQALRQLWTLTIQQLFPNLTFADALVQAETLQSAIDAAHVQLGAKRNTPQIHLPLAMPHSARYSRSGQAAVPVSALATRAFNVNKEQHLDLNTEQHRQAYQSYDLRHQAALQDRFTPLELRGKIEYPIDLENDFNFDPPKSLQAKLNRTQKAALKDLALVHLDGNGVGQLLLTLKDTLKNQSDLQYQQAFRLFSDALAKATVKAARAATEQLYQRVKLEQAEEMDSEIVRLPMRPIVLGGDDVTLYCRADLALDYAQTFCREFQTHSEIELADVFHDYLQESALLPYLTASGGIVYHKANHPFVQLNQLVESLCKQAKALTKGVPNQAPQAVGPAALAWFRIAQASRNQVQALRETQSINIQGQVYHNSLPAYFVEPQPGLGQNLTQLKQLMQLAQQTNLLKRGRQMLTALSQQDVDEAARIYHRGAALTDAKLMMAFEALYQQLLPHSQKGSQPWLLSEEEGGLQTLWQDLVILQHYQPLDVTQIAVTPIEQAAQGARMEGNTHD